MSLEVLLQELEKSFTTKKPFVFFISPKESLAHAYFLENDEVQEGSQFSNNGFIFASFNIKDNVYIFPYEYCRSVVAHFSSEKIKPIFQNFEETKIVKNKYEALVSEAIKTIASSPLEKVVLSRKASVPLLNFSIKKLTKRLASIHDGGLKYVWYHPKEGLWCGATPEVLFKKKNATIETMALAGTRKVSEQGNWGIKEKVEQDFVTKTIKEKLQTITNELTIGDLQTVTAGNIQHIKTKIVGQLKNSETTIDDIINILHPTPAICGTPTNLAKKHIHNHENHSRAFYTGFLGEITNDGSTTELFVNLRCMNIVDGTAHLYVGGGITADSIPENEWTETQNKLQTMLQVIQPFLY